MRKIEQKMVQAIARKRDWKNGNTRVEHDGSCAMIFLFGNHIGNVDSRGLFVNYKTLRRWPTRTTKSRLHALELSFGLANMREEKNHD